MKVGPVGGQHTQWREDREGRRCGGGWRKGALCEGQHVLFSLLGDTWQKEVEAQIGISNLVQIRDF